MLRQRHLLLLTLQNRMSTKFSSSNLYIKHPLGKTQLWTSRPYIHVWRDIRPMYEECVVVSRVLFSIFPGPTRKWAKHFHHIDFMHAWSRLMFDTFSFLSYWDKSFDLYFKEHLLFWLYRPIWMLRWQALFSTFRALFQSQTCDSSQKIWPWPTVFSTSTDNSTNAFI